MPDPSTRVTELLHAIDAGEAGAHGRLFEVLYGELRGIAHRQLAGTPSRATLQATALVNEAYLRLVGKAEAGFGSRRHFYFAAARAMHDILVEEARRKAAKRRGGDRKRVNLENLDLSFATPADDLLALDQALQTIEAEDVRRAEIIRLRFFAGLSEAETAEALGVSARTISREWRAARARLAVLVSPPESA